MEMKVSNYALKHGVSQRTVWRWIERGEIAIRKTATGRVRIIIDEPKETIVAVYARVSSAENKDNLERQKQRLVDYCNAKGYSVNKIITEVGSGLNDNRPKLESLLLDKTINVIVVEHKDRFSRFGTNYIEKLLLMQDRKLEVVNPTDNNEADLMQDFVSIITSFTARLYGQRRSTRKTEKILKELEA